MSKPKTTESAEKLKGSVKEAIGKLIGDGKIEAAGKAEQISAKADAKPKTASKP